MQWARGAALAGLAAIAAAFLLDVRMESDTRRALLALFALGALVT